MRNYDFYKKIVIHNFFFTTFKKYKKTLIFLSFLVYTELILVLE
ncbi:hypothetical protein Fleli_3920 [Bernardetia litoralis DSM 6794]|uniref:Uncharacterized protein n=1 Tax=Bernardetia litoralis (strain ATCC 23117 / DSM 6794 / NBRC 15988 / NCIMB 1366 / Fx l1 / Sio-4) TaxID=880071 RepID=I4AQI8_BERLS|nr:hypothetical protein Fleli_3920 [Bernardetia litoralis DSM 6794]